MTKRERTPGAAAHLVEAREKKGAHSAAGPPPLRPSLPARRPGQAPGGGSKTPKPGVEHSSEDACGTMSSHGRGNESARAGNTASAPKKA